MAITPALTTGVGAQSGGTSVLCGLTGAFTGGACVVVSVFLQDNTKTVTGFTDDTTGGPMAFTLQNALNVTGGRIEQWATTVNGSNPGGSYLRVNFSGSTGADASLEEVGGVAALGAVATATNTTANPSIALVTQDANNYVVAGFGSVGGATATALTGTLRWSQSSGGTPAVVCTTTDNTVVAAGSCVNAITQGAATWAAAALELRSTTGGVVPRSQLQMLGIG